MKMNSYKYYQPDYRANGNKLEKKSINREISLFFIIWK